MPIKRIEPDGTRVYTKGHRYRPLEDHERKIRRLKPENAEARGFVHWHGEWLPPLPLLDDEVRKMPWCVPDEICAQHELGCMCYGCRNSKRTTRLKRERLLKRG